MKKSSRRRRSTFAKKGEFYKLGKRYKPPRAKQRDELTSMLRGGNRR